ncbi:MAG TPA: hypothetical protein ENJ77_01695 [Candidatus Moranbacteria bacterium]|nr:hypothetical protein [Candidatus Moranbacteria bacterium]
MTEEKEIAGIRRTIAESLGWSDLSDPRAVELLDKAADVLVKRLFVVLLNRLGEEEREVLSEMIKENSDGQNDESIKDFLRSRFSAEKELIAAEVENFLTEIRQAASG